MSRPLNNIEQALKDEIASAARKLKEAQAAMRNARAKCYHPVGQVIGLNPITGANTAGLSATVRCEICGDYIGWYCPQNPNRDRPTCEYTEFDEECKYCGDPDERK